MRVEARNFVAFRSNHLKSSNSLPYGRFNDMDRAELENRLERLADVRSSVVARGKALVANPNYPDKKIIKQVSYLLAGKLQP
jgi:hypothetical protein